MRYYDDVFRKNLIDILTTCRRVLSQIELSQDKNFNNIFLSDSIKKIDEACKIIKPSAFDFLTEKKIEKLHTSEYYKQMEKTIEKNLEEKIRQETEKNLREKLTKEIRTELEPQIKAELKKERAERKAQKKAKNQQILIDRILKEALNANANSISKETVNNNSLLEEKNPV